MNAIMDGRVHLPKELLSPEDRSAVRDTLTVDGPDDDFGFGGKPKVIQFFEETETHFLVPRQWGLYRFAKKLEIEDRRVVGAPIDVTFRGLWRGGQQEFVDELLAGIEKQGRNVGGIGKAKAGFGKTVCAAGLIARIGRATLVIVPSQVLLRQWVSRMVKYLGVIPGVVHQDRCEFEGKPVVIALVHSLESRDYGDAFRNYFGVVICDEVHKGAAPTWVKAIQQFPAWWRIGLTATPRRGDGMHRALQWQVGPIVAEGVGKTMPARVEIVEWPDQISRRAYVRAKKPRLALFINELTEDPNYAEWIVEKFIVPPVYPRDGKPQRQVVVLSDRIEHLVYMKKVFDREKDQATSKDPFFGSALCVGSGHKIGEEKIKPTTDEEAAKAAVLFGTWQLLSTGFDLDTMSVLVMATPHSDVEQAIGRIQRLKDGKPEPVVVDIRYPDARWWLYRYEGARDRFYDKEGFRVVEP